VHDNEAQAHCHFKEYNKLSAEPVRATKYVDIDSILDQRGNNSPQAHAPRTAYEDYTGVEEEQRVRSPLLAQVAANIV